MNLRFACRQLRVDPGFTTVAVIILGLGIGGNTALFSFIHAVLLRPLPYPDADRIVVLSSMWVDQPASLGQVSGPDFADWRSRSSVFEALAAYSVGETSVSAHGDARYAEVASVTRGFDRVMRVRPARGRWFAPHEEGEGGPPLAVVSHQFAEQAFAGDALGKPIKILDRLRTVIGVMPPNFSFPGKTDIWTPSGAAMENESRTAQNWQVVARTKSGVSLQQARAQMDAIALQLATQHPKDNREKRLAVMPLRERLVRDVRRMLLMLFGSVAMVLAIACANVANLLLAKGSARSKELALRTALGATRGRIVAQLLTESLILGVLGGTAGVLIGNILLRAAMALAPANMPGRADVQMDWVVLTFTAGISLASTVTAGLIPALKALRIDVNDSLKQSAGRTTTTPKLPRALVAGEIAIATMLAIGAALVIQTFGGLLTTGLGFEMKNVLVTDVGAMSSPHLEGALRNVRWHRQTTDEIKQIPGVISAAGVLGVPGAKFHSSGSYLAGAGSFDLNKVALFTLVSPGYFSTMRIVMLAGRDFSDSDNYDAPFVAIVNRTLAKQVSPEGDVMGRQIQCGLDSDTWMTVVGVVEGTRTLGPAAPEQPEIYMPAMQHPALGQRMSFVVRTASQLALNDPIQRAVRRNAPEFPVKSAALEVLLADNIARPRFRAFVLGSMASLAVLLAMAGTYGVMSYAMGLRRAEFGVRMAMGAKPGDIVRMVLGQGAAVALAGLATGIAGALASARLLESMILGVPPRDPATYAGVAVAVLFVTLAANLGPAIRAGRVNPITTLR